MEVNEAIKKRRSVRKFKSNAIPKEKILRILEAANLAPTATNRQPWNFVVVSRSFLDQMSEITDKSFKERLKDIGRDKMEQGISELPIPIEGSEDKVNGLNKFYKTMGDAPVAVVVHVKKEVDPWQWKNNICDASAAIQNLLLAAWSEGIASCWMTGPLKKKEREIREFLQIPESQEIIGIIPLGLPEYVPESPPKKRVETMTRWLGL